MSDYAIIVQNDESKWDDIKGDIYHYPSTYKRILTVGCRVIYYKGTLHNKEFLALRLSPDAHYFGTAVIGDSIIDPDSPKKDRFCEILDYKDFEEAVPIKVDGEYLETIPPAKEPNYWRYGVREISRSTYEKILYFARIKGYSISLPNEDNELESYELIDGTRRGRFSTYYERNPFYRNKAIELHGLSCEVCGFNFEENYGELGRGFIHVHHNKPISETGPTRINPITDLSALCPNCHAMIHRNKDQTLDVDVLKTLIKAVRQGEKDPKAKDFRIK